MQLANSFLALTLSKLGRLSLLYLELHSLKYTTYYYKICNCHYRNKNVLNSPDGNKNPEPLQKGEDCNAQQDQKFF
jgi:hypothetical protein